ncbi:hypothetical protein NQ317_016463 [Molorchus minor]|uniref:RNA helicase n=1 Tax=Molorchus minor TaxID=1323400 RepID=A0ABQ9K2Q5_9CUCU|nr:hypothetical protein NQ317_016463 [Molorchus minor]
MLKMSGMLAHSLDSQRSRDISLEGNISFESLLLNENLLNGLTKNGYKKPSPIQIKAIPVGRCGFDVIVKSKSGTGKTLLHFETVEVLKTQTQVLILAPTREIVVQIEEVISTVGTFIEGLHVTSFIGGLPIKEDIEKCKDCHIAVGAPGRVKHLITEGILKINSVRLLVLDEVDKLMENSFVNDINEIYNNLTGRVQVITTSATYTNEIKTFLHKFMLSPTQVVVEDETPLLWGLKQFVQVIDSHPNVVQQTKAKTDVILKILTRLSFTQCIIFTNYQIRAESISNTLNQKGHASLYISAARTQVERLAAVKDLRNFKCRIMLSTDLTARGIDAANVDLVINYDVPVDANGKSWSVTAPQRICINLVSRTGELQQLQNILNTIGGPSMSIPELPDFNGDIKDLLNLEVPNEKHILAISSDVITSKSNNTTANLNVENTSKKEKAETCKKMLNKSPDSVSNHIEDIFKIGYECATGKLSEHWRYYFPDLDNGNSSLLLKEEISDYDETEKSCSEDLIDRTGDLRDEENPVADYMKWIPVEKSEAIDFEKSGVANK